MTQINKNKYDELIKYYNNNKTLEKINDKIKYSLVLSPNDKTKILFLITFRNKLEKANELLLQYVPEEPPQEEKPSHKVIINIPAEAYGGHEYAGETGLKRKK